MERSLTDEEINDLQVFINFKLYPFYILICLERSLDTASCFVVAPAVERERTGSEQVERCLEMNIGNATISVKAM